jgi:phosphoglycolate phosphatase-like HAD superfamily hydrolase
MSGISPQTQSMERIRDDHPRGPFRCAVLDFDGTLSLLRADWQGLMTRMMVDILAATGTPESATDLTAIVQEFVVRLTGEPTIAQMQALAEHVRRRGQAPRELPEYLAQYGALLMAEAGARIDAIRACRQAPDEHLVPGARRLLSNLEQQGLLLVLASGTELSHVIHETEVLKLTAFFGPRIHGPVGDDPSFSKQHVIEQLLAQRGWCGNELVVIGDGTAEIRAAKSVGALAIGVASDEVARGGRVNQLKREHLLRAGADVIVPDFQCVGPLLELFGLEPRMRDGETERRREAN